jgi:hypothetical protein
MRFITSRLCSAGSTGLFAAASKYRRSLMLLCLCAGSTGILALYISTPPVKQALALDAVTKQPSVAPRTENVPLASDNSPASSPSSQPDQRRRAELVEAYGKLPLSFEANKGQTGAEVKFYSRGEGYGLFLTSDGAVLNLSTASKRKSHAVHTARPEATSDETALRHTDILRMRLVGADPSAQVSGEDELPGRVNYFIGHDSQKWRTDIQTFAKVRYRNVYRGVDLVYYGNQQQLEYDFVVAPGTDPNAITLGYEGIQKAEIEANGDLALHEGGGVVRQQRPRVYQLIGGIRRSVDAHYILKGKHEVGFAVAHYDADEPLVIDPVLVYSTYFGGKYSDDSFGIAVDAEGNAYVTGSTYSNDFHITPGSFQTETMGIAPNYAARDAYVMKLNQAGNGVVYSTFLGGQTDNDEARGIALDGSGNAYVCGMSASTDFPTTPGAFQPNSSGGLDNGFRTNDAFITKLNPAGNALVYSTYLGGLGVDEAYALALDSASNVYVTGTTGSANFPVTSGAPQPIKATWQDVFITKLNNTGTALAYSTFLGGSNSTEWGYGIAVDASGNAYVAGATHSSDFPTTPGAFQTTSGASGYMDGFVAKLNAAGTSFIYSTLLGGNADDGCEGLAVDAQGRAYVTGYTQSNNFPTTPGAYRTQFNGARYLSSDIIVTKLNETGTQLVYSTYVSSNVFDSSEGAQAIAINPDGEAFIAAGTGSRFFPTTADALQRTVNDDGNIVLFKLNASGSALLYSTYLGGSGQEVARAITLDSAGSIYLTGLTQSTNFPITPGAFQTFPGGGAFDTGGFVTKIGVPVNNTLSVGGRVTDGGNGIGGVMLRLSGSLTGTQWSDEQGNYSFGNLPAGGNYAIDVSSPYYDFSPQSQSFNNLNANATANFAGTMRHFNINGRIADTNGTGIADVTVSLSGAQTATTQTDSGGNYTFGNLPATGSYGVQPAKLHYFFDPYIQSFTSLNGDRTANFKAFLFYTISGRLVSSSTGQGLSHFRINITGTQSGYAITDDDGKFDFRPLIPGGNFTVTPQFPDFAYTPPSYSFTNLNSDQKADFSASWLYGNVSGRITDENGKGVNDAVVLVDGQPNPAYHTDSTGGFLVYGLSKGTNHTLTAQKLGYAISPASVRVTIVNDDNNANFLGLTNQLQPFTSGGILVSCENTLSEYTADGKLVQAIPVPYPGSSPNTQLRMGDIVLDRSGEVEIYNGDFSPYLTSYNFKQSAWRNHTYEDWDTWGNNTQAGIATYANYIFVTDRGLGQPPGTGGMLRINLDDFSSQRFATTLEFRDLNIGLDGLLYALTDTQIYVYQPLSLSPVRTINLDSNVAFTVNSIAVNAAGDIFSGTNNGYFYHFNPNGAVLKSLYVGPIGENVADIEVSPGGQIVAGNSYGRVFLTNESLSNLTSFAVGHSASFVAFTNTVPPQTSSVRFGAANYAVDEGAGSATITVTREGDISGPASVDYLTTDESAHQRSDYTLASGTLNFAPGESSQHFNVLITDNAYVDGSRTLNLVLRNSKNAPALNPSTATLTITDNDTAAPTANPIDDAQLFVRQQYADFLNRSPDDGGLAYWSNQISLCGSDPLCIHQRRVGVADAFFFEDEFQKTGAYLYRLSKTGLGQRPSFTRFMADRGLVVAGSQLEASKTAYALAFVQREAFLQLYPRSQSAAQFVTALLTSIEQHSGVNLTTQRSALQSLYDGTDNGRAAILRQVADNQAVIEAEYNPSFVLMEYFGYLRRDPDEGGYGFWLGQVKKFPLRDVGIQHAMACSFITSAEYQTRFSSVVTHTNRECQQ